MPPHSMRFKIGPKLWIPVALLAFAVADGAKSVSSMHAEGMHHNWALLFEIEALSWLPWVVGSLAVVWLADVLRRLPPALEWSAHGVAAVGIGLATTVWSDQLILHFQPFAPEFAHWIPQWPNDFYNSLPATGVLYACVLLCYKLIDSRARVSAHETEVAQLNEQLARADLHALRSQIEPHFLFNALNAVAGLIREKRADAAVETLVQLSDFLRRTLTEASRQEVSLADEMEFVRRYLAIQQTRFSDRLRIDIDVPEALQGAAVPNLILQPLVENAIKHGIAKRQHSGAVRVAATATGGSLDLYVANDGPELGGDWDEREHTVGIRNVRRRLLALYGDATSFDIRDRHDGGGVEVAIRIPLRPIVAEGHG